MTNPFTHASRGRMSPQRIARVFAANGGKCAGACGRKLGPSDDYDIDHIIALENGGTDDDSNLQVLCSWCHTDKTADDHSTAGHARRAYTNHVVPKRFRKSKGWRT